MADMSPEVADYMRAMRWLRDVGEALSEARYHTVTPKTVIDLVEKLEASAKEWVTDSTKRMNEAILKRPRPT